MRYLILMGFLLFSTSCFALERPVELKEDESLSGTFSQKRYLSGFEHPIESQGEFYFDKNTGLIWKTLAPFETKLVISQTGMSQSVDGQQTIKLSSDQFPGLKTLHDLLSLSLQGQWGDLENRFGAKLTELKGGWSLSVDAPNDAPFKSVFLEGADYLNKLVILKPQDDRDEINFSGQTVLKVK